MISEQSLKLLDFPKLLAVISDFTHSEASKNRANALRPLQDIEEIRLRQESVSEIMRMSSEGQRLSLRGFRDIEPLLAKARPAGAVLDGSELAAFIPVIEMISMLHEETTGRQDLPRLASIGSELTGFPDLLKILTRSLDEDGNILDTASFLLSDLREKIRRIEGRIRKKLEDIMKDSSVSVFLQDDFITMRSGRWVIPVRMDSKGEISGVVHDVSKSGETAFIEPLSIISHANEHENLLAEHKAEEIRILREISAKIRLNTDELLSQFNLLVSIDVMNAAAKLGLLYNMSMPQVENSGELSIIGGRHPLLFISFVRSDNGRRVVPLDVKTGNDSTIMVITGSNAGGKTVAIKTIGILLSMALTGLPVSADSGSKFPIKKDVLIDIGDEQSIESNLSTFSAHVSNISEILKSAGKETLVLIDELGTGTDPAEGAALACAVLNELRESRALVFATTHLMDIKGYVHRTEGMINASMEFDLKTMTPLYRLRTGEPGQSHALEIARKYGLPDSIIESAKRLLGGVRVEFDKLIADLNDKRSYYERLVAELEAERSELKENIAVLDRRVSEAEAAKKQTLADAYRESVKIISETKGRMNSYLDEMKKNERAAVKSALKQIGDMQKETTAKLNELEDSTGTSTSPDSLSEGDTVYVRTLGCDAQIVEINLKNDRVRVSVGGKEIEVPMADIGAKKGIRLEETKKRPYGDHKNDTVDSSGINLVGMRVDEALSVLEPFLNHASLDGLNEVVLIHGIGTGALAKGIHTHLKRHPLIKSFRKGEPKEGGGGVTVVSLA
ncbi:MAG: endonuclease MutS2 [Nitrospirae bacterium]|nr:MAG: endonuclease MutS2 [Nitrospirota bacterium]